MTFIFLHNGTGRFRWIMVDKGGRNCGESSVTYSRMRDAKRAAFTFGKSVMRATLQLAREATSKKSGIESRGKA